MNGSEILSGFEMTNILSAYQELSAGMIALAVIYVGAVRVIKLIR